MTMARIQPCLRKWDDNLGYYNGKEKWPPKTTEKNLAGKLHNNHFVFCGNLKVLVLLKL